MKTATGPTAKNPKTHIMCFGIHPSPKLQALFAEKPYQLQEPEKAKIVFLGRDANWDINIGNDPIFPEFEEYLKDGVSYWKTHLYHTPMLNPAYKGGGKRYHERFKKIGFTFKNAEDICFFELLKFPTCGQSSKHREKYIELVRGKDNEGHIDRLRKLQRNKNITIFIPLGLKKIIESLDVFDSDTSNVVYHVHFSNAISNIEINRIKRICLAKLNK